MGSSRGVLAVVSALLCAPVVTGLAGPAAVVSRTRAPVSRVSMAEVPAFAVDGSQTGTATVSLRQSSKPMYVVHRKVLCELNNRRAGTAVAKTRSEVSGGGKKPYQQKGTGRARRGSSRSPLIVGGGASHGPTPKDWTQKMNKKERRVATASAIMGVISRAIVVDDIESEFSQPKTKAMKELLDRLPLDQKAPKPPKVTLITKDKDDNVVMSGRNIDNLALLHMNNINVHDIVGAGKLVITKSALEAMNERYGTA